MSENKINEALRQILSELKLPSTPAQIPDSKNLFSSGILDSLSLVQFVLLVEERFKIRVENADITYEQFNTLEAMVGLLKNTYKI